MNQIIDVICAHCGDRIKDRNYAACAGSESCEPWPIVSHVIDVNPLPDGWLLHCLECSKGHIADNSHDAAAWGEEHPCEPAAVAS